MTKSALLTRVTSQMHRSVLTDCKSKGSLGVEIRAGFARKMAGGGVLVADI
jgi:hypothetical protein